MDHQPLLSGHEIPAHFASAPQPDRPRSRHGRIILIVVGAVMICGAGIAVHTAANLRYDDVRIAYSDAATVVENRQTDLLGEIDQLRSTGELAAEITASDSGSLLPAQQRSTLDRAIEAIETTAGEADDVAAEALPDVGDKPSWTWELFAESTQMEADAVTADELGDDVAQERDDVASAADDVDEAAVEAVTAAAAGASEFEQAHVNARNPEIVALRHAATAITEHATALDEDTVSMYADLESAAAGVLRTEKAELAEKEGSLRGARIEIEKFARGLAPGVLLDFDWSPTVSGYDGPSYGGWTTWWYGEPGYATIALSDYIAESWPAGWAKALVAHEVGHAISVKCEKKYDSSSQDTIEEWATAWAISMGFTDTANGTDVYGAPSQKMIEAAADCR